MKEPRVLILLNQRSGTLANSATRDEAQRILDRFAAVGLAAEARQVDPAHAKAQVEYALETNCTAILVGGGDGTINAMANAVVGTDLVFAVLPLGTHNHFAKELGIPDDLEAAADALARSIATGQGVQPLDVGDVNGNVFLNFSGIGLHPKLVEEREIEHEQMKRFVLARKLLRKFTKPLSMLVAFFKSMADLPILRLGIETDVNRRVRITPAMLIGNNVHQMQVFGLDEVSVPRRDVLNAYIARTRQPIALVRMLLAALTGRLAAIRQFESIASTHLTVYNRRRTLKVSLDGEVLRLRTPLRYTIRKGALMVAAPHRVTEKEVASTV